MSIHCIEYNERWFFRTIFNAIYKTIRNDVKCSLKCNEIDSMWSEFINHIFNPLLEKGALKII